MSSTFDFDAVSVLLLVVSALVVSVFLEIRVRALADAVWWDQAALIRQQERNNVSLEEVLEGADERRSVRQSRVDNLRMTGYGAAWSASVLMAATFSTMLARTPYRVGGYSGIGQVDGFLWTALAWGTYAFEWAIALGFLLGITYGVATTLVGAIAHWQGGPALPLTICPSCRMPCGDAWECARCGTLLPNLGWLEPGPPERWESADTD